MTVVVENVDGEFADAVAARLADVERALVDAAQARTPFVSEAATHIINAGGKRFRPLLVMCAGLLGREDQAATPDQQLVDSALVVELTHVASLYHDDVMDEADTRRGAPSAHTQWGNNVAILVGDFLFSRASAIVAGLGTEYVARQADTFARLVQGQIAETQGPGGADPLAHHLQVIADKTGSLIATSAVFGGMQAGLEPEQLRALEAFGEEIGVTFQLSDDIIDIVSDTTGKTPGTDLREGVPTLPTLMLRRNPGPQDARLLELLDGDLTSDAALAEALGLLRAHPVLDEARAEVQRRADAARSHLAPLPEGPARDALSALCDRVVSRDA